MTWKSWLGVAFVGTALTALFSASTVKKAPSVPCVQTPACVASEWKKNGALAFTRAQCDSSPVCADYRKKVLTEAGVIGPDFKPDTRTDDEKRRQASEENRRDEVAVQVYRALTH